jgi:hypothetical protein
MQSRGSLPYYTSYTQAEALKVATESGAKLNLSDGGGTVADRVISQSTSGRSSFAGDPESPCSSRGSNTPLTVSSVPDERRSPRGTTSEPNSPGPQTISKAKGSGSSSLMGKVRSGATSKDNQIFDPASLVRESSNRVGSDQEKQRLDTSSLRSPRGKVRSEGESSGIQTLRTQDLSRPLKELTVRTGRQVPAAGHLTNLQGGGESSLCSLASQKSRETGQRAELDQGLNRIPVPARAVRRTANPRDGKGSDGPSRSGRKAEPDKRLEGSSSLGKRQLPGDRKEERGGSQERSGSCRGRGRGAC